MSVRNSIRLILLLGALALSVWGTGGCAAVKAAQASAPDTPAQRAGRAAYTEGTVTLPTYPYVDYQTDAYDATYHWPYRRFDRERFLADAPTPTPHTYRLVTLENDDLRLTILPELGGRIWQVIHKPSGNAMFYQNPVVKPSPWGPPQQLGWLGLGGLEWNVPVIEHGYDWGTPWEVQAWVNEAGDALATIATPDDGRLPATVITVTLPASGAYFEIEPSVRNLGERELEFDYWHTAMLAPGTGNKPSADMHFVLPATEMTVHSTADPSLPQAEGLVSWPVVAGRDLSRLGNWDQYLGLFEAPAAQGPMVGVYDEKYDAGAVRIFPPEVTRGSKLFALGWEDALPSDYFTDDGSAYVELHAGLAPSFFEKYRLPGHGSVSWRERWYPVYGIDRLSAAGPEAALSVQRSTDGVQVGVYAVTPLAGRVVVEADGREVAAQPFYAAPDAPYTGTLKAPGMARRTATGFAPFTVIVEDGAGRELLRYHLDEGDRLDER